VGPPSETPVEARGEGGTVTVVVNGQNRKLPVGVTVADVVRELAGDEGARGVAVAVDGEVVPRGRWDDVALAGGERIEVVRAVQGG
jgi:sulfur carrier protein